MKIIYNKNDADGKWFNIVNILRIYFDANLLKLLINIVFIDYEFSWKKFQHFKANLINIKVVLVLNIKNFLRSYMTDAIKYPSALVFAEIFMFQRYQITFAIHITLLIMSRI